MLFHELLQIPELKFLIFEQLGSKEVVRVAATSRQLFGLCMPLAWQDVSGASQLFALIARAVITRTNRDHNAGLYAPPACETIVLPESIDEQGLVRARLYGSFVRSIKVFGEPHTEYRLESWRALWHHTRMRPLLPNLVSITCSNSWFGPSQQFPWLTLFISPVLQEFRVVGIVKVNPPCTPHEVCRPLFRALSNTCPNLRTLAIYPGNYSVPATYGPCPGIGDCRYFFQHFKSLKTLATKGCFLQAGALEILSHSAVLESLDIYQGCGSASLFISTLPLGEFPALRHLGLLGCPNDEIIRRFYETLPQTANRLTSLEVQYRNNHPNGGEMPLAAVAYLISQGSPHLTNLSLELTGEPLTVNYIWHVSFETLKVLAVLPLQQLCMISASLDCPLGSIAGLFPCLRSLKLPHHYLELSELHTFVEKMPGIEQLTLAIGLQLDAVPEDIPILPPSCRLRVVESDFTNRVLAYNRPFTMTLLTHEGSCKLVHFFHALSPKVKLVPKVYFVGWQHRANPPFWESYAKGAVAWVNECIAALAHSPGGQRNSRFQAVFNKQSWEGYASRKYRAARTSFEP
ncbi:hypothetical protein FRC08_003931 [Ceratobasidium sp. 394]|nr:hypothetical protein FRC08_003931 [Ceratobasidium sp. 394]KAG9100599.1 hypothetical protein FS749_014189 [Ceratobasidium sp. UAMH 11750]